MIIFNLYSFRGDFAMEFEINLTSVKDVQDFVALATSRPFPVTVGNARHRVNGKNFMEMFCLDFTRPLVAAAQCSEEEFLAFRQDVQRFLTQ